MGTIVAQNVWDVYLKTMPDFNKSVQTFRDHPSLTLGIRITGILQQQPWSFDPRSDFPFARMTVPQTGEQYGMMNFVLLVRSSNCPMARLHTTYQTHTAFESMQWPGYKPYTNQVKAPPEQWNQAFVGRKAAEFVAEFFGVRS